MLAKNELLTVDSAQQLFELVDLALDARLGERVVVLDRIEQGRDAPEAVRLQRLQLRPFQQGDLERAHFGS